MATNNNEIPNINTDWQGYSGKSVQDFIKKMIRQTISELGGKFGHVTYESGQMRFYDTDGGTSLGAVTITGTSYTVNVETNHKSNNIVVLTSDISSIITLTPTTESIEFGSTVKEDFPEDYTFKLEIDSGQGYIDRTPTNNIIKNGESVDVDIRRYLTTGINKARIVVTGSISGQPKTLVFSVTLTSLSLNVEHPWHQVWMQGNNYFVQNIYFSGNIQKTLHIKVGDVEYTQDYSASTQYVNVPTTFDLTNYTPTESGVVPLEIWMTGEGVETQHIYYQIMYVADADKGNISLICFNNIPAKVYNFRQEDLVQYSVYNIGSVNTLVKASYGDKEEILLENSENITSNTIYTLSLSLQIDTDLLEGIRLYVEVSGNGVSKNTEIIVDNSNAFIATPGAKFYLNSSLGSNSTPDRDKIINSAPISEGFDAIYDATWSGFTFSKDAWDYDKDGNRALVIKAGSTLKIPNLKPLRTTTDQSTTFEIMYRAGAVADYDTPIFTCIDTETYNKDTSVGIIIFPTRVLILSKETRNEVFQQLLLGEDRINHIIISFQKKFGGKANNLCRIFINGVENVTFTYKDTDTFYPNTALQYGGIVAGQSSTDTYIYMMRIYNKGFEEQDVRANFLNAVIESANFNRLGFKADNDVLDGNSIDYYMVKKAGFNTYVVETDQPLPSLKNPVSYSKGVNIHLEYNDHPEWNVSIYDAPLDRQGTTSSLYMWANLRSKIKKALVWRYHNLKDSAGNVLEETGKNGYLFGYKSRPKVQKITWKKNVASQPQGHKMGATGIFNDLFKQVFGAEKLVTEGILPSIDTRVATEQIPFIGFQLDSNGQYSFIGMYTGGPDKTDKKTFGYDRTDIFPKLMMIEGPNHDPYMTRFLVPWTEDVFYDYLNETLSIGAESPSDGSKQEGWDADIVGDYSTDSEEDADAIMNLYLSEFKPAYDAIYYCSPYIVSLDEALASSGYSSLDDINNNLSSYQKKETNGYSNILLTLYDSQYRLIYYRVKTGKYEVLPLSTHNMLEYLGLSGTPTTEEIIEARRQKWINPDSGVAKYVNLPEAYYHNVFCEFLGVTDNDAKNTYWRKFKEIALGGKWGFNQDDLDTLMQNDNNGQDTKEYYVEPNDTLNGNDIFQGRTSAFWYALRLWCKDNIKGMANEFIQAAYDKAEALNISGNSIHERVLGLVSYYMWQHSSKYFPAAIYNADTKLAYIDVWYENPSALYNNVPPLTQIHGDHYETERAWMIKRIAYFFSKYQLGAFKSSSADNYGSLEFTPASGFDMKVTPAIWLYPRISIGGSETEQSVRTPAGNTCTLSLPSSGTTGVYIKGLDWLSDLGDLSKLQLTSRGGSDVISFSVNGKRLRKLKVGDANEEVLFNATNLAVVGDTLEEIDAQNASTIQGTLDLKNCPRLRNIYLQGTALTSVFPPVGGRVLKLQLPNTLATLFLHNLNLLTDDNLTLSDDTKANLTTLYINSCDNLNAFNILKEIYNTEGNKLANIGIIWKGTIEDSDSSNMQMLGAIAKVSGQEGGYRGVVYNENGDIETGGKVNINGSLNINYPVYQDDVDAILEGIPDLKVSYDPNNTYIRFKDAEVQRICATKWGDGNGVTKEQVKKVTDVATTFNRNAIIETFNEFKEFINVVELSGYSPQGAFRSCTSLREITLPETMRKLNDGHPRNNGGGGCFYGATSLGKCNGTENVKYVGACAFYDCKSLTEVNLKSATDIRSWAFMNCSNLSEIGDTSSVNSLGTRAFMNCAKLSDVSFPALSGNLGSDTFSGCTSLKRIGSLGSSIKKISDGLGGQFGDLGFAYNCTSLEYVDLSRVNDIGNYAFYGCSLLSDIGEQCDELFRIGNSAFEKCTSLAIEDLSIPNLEQIGKYAFSNTKIKKVSNLGNITAINSYTFNNCTSLIEFTDPINNCTYESNCFTNCTSLTKININDNEKWFRNTFKSDTANPIRYAKNFYINDELVDTMKVPSDLITIGNYVLQNWKGTTVDFGDSAIETIGAYSFKDCTNLTNCNIPQSVKTINDRAFQGCTSLEFDTLNLPNLTSIGNYALDGVKIRKLVITSLVNLPTQSGTLEAKSTLQEVVLSSKCTTLPASVFSDYTNLNTINLGLITTFNSSCLKNTGLTGTLSIPNATGTLDVSAFYNTKITNIANLGSVTQLGSSTWNDGVFQNCSLLETVTLPETLTIIGVNCFSNDKQLKTINFPESITTIAYNGFNNCNNLEIESLSLPNLTSLSDAVFGNCYKLKRVTNLGSITKILVPSNDKGVFYNCTNLKVVVLPATLETLGSQYSPFVRCTSLEDVVCYATIPPAVACSTIFPKNKLKGIYVPDSSIDAYRSATNWSNYYDYIYPISDYVEGIPPMKFEDAAVESIILTNYDTNKSGYLSNTELLAIKNMNGKFDNNATIETFNELDQFTSLTQMPTFQNCTSLSEIKLPTHLNSMPSSMFKGCTALTSFAIPDTVQKLNGDTFNGSGLSSLTSWGGITELSGNNNFQNCISLSSIPSLSTLTKISGNGTFAGCTNLTSVSGLNNLTQIGENTFSECTNLNINNLNLPNLTTLKSGAFYKCTSLTGSINLPSLTNQVDYSTFRECTSIINVLSLGSITKIQNNAFFGCTSLQSVNLPSTLTAIYLQAFYNCSNMYLPNNKLPESITIIDEKAFEGCTRLRIDELYLPNLKTINGGFESCDIRKITNLGSITKVAGFSNNANLISVVLPETVTTIYDSAFADCTSLTTINIPETVTTIGYRTFNNCTSLVIDELYLPNLQTLNTQSFNQVQRISRITSLGQITILPNTCFRLVSCDSIILPDTLLTIKGQETLPLCPTIVLPASVTDIEECIRGNTVITNFICKATVPPSVARNNWSETTSLQAIYVPDDSVEAYKAATNWSTKASIIYGISDIITNNPELYEEIKDQLGGGNT